MRPKLDSKSILDHENSMTRPKISTIFLLNKGLLATLNGLVGGLHYGLGKGTGSLVGGALIASFGSTAYAFRIFGLIALVCGLLYTFYAYVILRCCLGDKTMGEVQQKEEPERDDENAEKDGFLSENLVQFGGVPTLENENVDPKVLKETEVTVESANNRQ